MKISEEVRFLEEAYDELNKKYFESALPKVAITIQSTPHAHGHFTTWDAWVEENAKTIKEINLGAESLKRPVEDVIATLMHEMVHYFCMISKIKEVSRGGTYHNKRFKAEAEKRGLVIEYHPSIGYSLTKPSDELKCFIEEKNWVDKLTLYRINLSKKKTEYPDDGDSDEEVSRKKSSTRKYICTKCGMSVRATKDVAIACINCKCRPMVLAS